MPFVQLAHLRVHYEAAGQGEQAVVFVHGNFASARFWRPILERVPTPCRALAPSTRGCGETESTSGGYAIEELAGDLAKLTLAMSLPPFVLVGHSLGTAIATQLAIDHPARVRSLLLVSPAPTAGIGALRGSGSDLSRLLRLFDADDPGQRVALEALLRWGQAFGVYRGSLRRGLQELVGRVPAPQLEVLLDDAALLSPEPILGFLAALQHWRPGLQLGRVTAPVTVLWGEDDPIISREIAAATAGDFPNSKLLIWRGAGHSPQLEQPGPFADLAFGLALNPRLPQDSPG